MEKGNSKGNHLTLAIIETTDVKPLIDYSLLLLYFRMSFKDFVANYQRLEICFLGPDSLKDEAGDRTFHCTLFEGGWKPKVNAGGCLKNRGLYLFLSIPFNVIVGRPDDSAYRMERQLGNRIL